MTADYKDPNRGSGRKLTRLIGLVLLAAAIGGSVFLLSREAALGGGRLLHYGLRAGLVVFALAAWFWSQALIGRRSL